MTKQDGLEHDCSQLPFLLELSLTLYACLQLYQGVWLSSPAPVSRSGVLRLPRSDGVGLNRALA